MTAAELKPKQRFKLPRQMYFKKVEKIHEIPGIDKLLIIHDGFKQMWIEKDQEVWVK